ncbi:hypothetical protein TOPH_05729 [Tolypocladium ophioglossoides CBS 100239]|uniref:Uncharacterized protein n=1 Tax=Tolypocladium ophioglossoides (strain CBS 100239) TaxID=1163406 RepID=A0A0L0N6R2_TOLOC|nr:hypothetical protein TOPH_05729 [Tolypocladium ophioglossoides CBS 100239]
MFAHRGRGGPSRSTPANVQCQKCLKRDMYAATQTLDSRLTPPARHYSYECKSSTQERPYVSRPSRSQQLRNPKLVPKLTNNVLEPEEKKKGVADEEIAKRETERAKKRELDDRDDELIKSSSKRRRSASTDSVLTISTDASRDSRPPRSKKRGDLVAAAAAAATVAARRRRHGHGSAPYRVTAAAGPRHGDTRALHRVTAAARRRRHGDSSALCRLVVAAHHLHGDGGARYPATAAAGPSHGDTRALYRVTAAARRRRHGGSSALCRVTAAARHRRHEDSGVPDRATVAPLGLKGMSDRIESETTNRPDTRTMTTIRSSRDETLSGLEIPGDHILAGRMIQSHQNQRRGGKVNGSIAVRWVVELVALEMTGAVWDMGDGRQTSLRGSEV